MLCNKFEFVNFELLYIESDKNKYNEISCDKKYIAQIMKRAIYPLIEYKIKYIKSRVVGLYNLSFVSRYQDKKIDIFEFKEIKLKINKIFYPNDIFQNEHIWDKHYPEYFDFRKED